uniref:Protein kinase n=1 Tax=Pithovirus LCPAC101 TaxID=2506586 RepID=A0A481Z460_9VIRU|nr:MAG: hypothetical protein LCPAC101_00620 [Pithovirus LCPAC101]
MNYLVSDYTNDILEYLSQISSNVKGSIEYIYMLPSNFGSEKIHKNLSDDYSAYRVKLVVSNININTINNNKQNFISNLEKIYNKIDSNYNVSNIEIGTNKTMLYIWFDISYNVYTDVVDLGRIYEKYSINTNSLPTKLNINDNLFIIDKYLNKGGQATIYEGNYIHNGEKIPVVFREGNHYEVPDKIKHYFAKEYVIFDAKDSSMVTIMEKLYPLIFNDNIFVQSLNFLDDIKKYNLGHGDATPNNIMMDIHGNMKLIDYTPGETYTRQYGKNDRMFIPMSLYEIKNHDKIGQASKDIIDDINHEIQKLPEPKDRLFTFMSDMGNNNYSKFNKFISDSDNISLIGSFYMLQLLYSIRSLLIEVNNVIDFKDFDFKLYTRYNFSDGNNATFDMIDNLSDKHNIRYTLYKKDFIVWLLDNINNDKYDDTYLKIILEEIDSQ